MALYMAVCECLEFSNVIKAISSFRWWAAASFSHCSVVATIASSSLLRVSASFNFVGNVEMELGLGIR